MKRNNFFRIQNILPFSSSTLPSVFMKRQIYINITQISHDHICLSPPAPRSLKKRKKAKLEVPVVSHRNNSAYFLGATFACIVYRLKSNEASIETRRNSTERGRCHARGNLAAPASRNTTVESCIFSRQIWGIAGLTINLRSRRSILRKEHKKHFSPV